MMRNNNNDRNNAQFFEDITFNDYAYAQSQAVQTERKMKLSLISVGIAALASIFSTVGFTHNDELGNLVLVGLLLSIVAYVMGGGFKMALRLAWNLAKMGWIVAPFPLDLPAGLITLFLAIYSFLFFPLLFVLLSFFQLKRTNREAQEYLNFFNINTNSDRNR